MLPTTLGAPGAAIRRTTLLTVAVVALAARLLPVLAAGTLRGVLGYDDGVYLAAAQRLVAGIVPYRDEVFLHPPGIAVALTPFAALAGPFGDSWALALARLAFMVLGALNAVLVARILIPRGVFAAAVGGGGYALWGAAISAEQTLYLEVPIGLGLLVALGALARARPGPGPGPRAGSRVLAVSGLALGVAVTMKIWVGVDAAVLGALVLARGGLRAGGRWLGWLVLGAAPILLPFLVMAPGQLWRDVIWVQGARPVQNKNLTERLQALEPGAAVHAGLSWPVGVAVGAAVLALVGGPLVWVLRRRMAPAAWPDPVWWGVLAAFQLAALAAAPSFYLHYAAFAVPALSLLLGAGAGRLLAAVRASRGRWARVGPAALVAVALAVGLGVALTRPPLPTGGRVDNAVLADFAARSRCVWARNPSYLQVADAAGRQDRARCRSSLDLVGTWLALEGGAAGSQSAAASIDRLILAQLRASDGALLSVVRPSQGFGRRARSYLHANFRAVGSTGEIQLWARR